MDPLAYLLAFVTFVFGLGVGEWMGGFRVRKTSQDPDSMPYTKKIFVDAGWTPPTKP